MFVGSTLAVIIPVYNGERFIGNAIKSVISQTLQPNEIIVVNDGSTDDSFRILNELQTRHKQIKVVDQENKGVSYARNKAVELCSSDILVFIDTDDCWHPQKLEIQLEKLQQHDLDMICTNVIQISDSDSTLPKYDLIYDSDKINTKVFSLEEIIYEPHLTTSSVMVKNSVFNYVNGFDVNFRTAEDQAFYVDVAIKFKVGCVDAALTYKRYVEDSLSSGFDSYTDSIKVLERFIEMNPVLSSKKTSIMRKAKARIYREFTADLLWNNEVLSSLKPLVLSVKEFPTFESLKLFLKFIKLSILNLFGIKNTNVKR